LAGVAGSEIALEIAPGQTVRVPFDQVQKANLKFEW
jgi:ribosome maturation factor RimP